MAGAVSSGGKKETIYVNVVNLIDILIILIVFLLTNFATSTFEDITTMPAKMPVFGGQPPDEPMDQPDKKTLQNLEVRMKKEGDQTGFQIVVTVSGEAPTGIDVPLKENKEFDFEKLSEELYKIKQVYEARQDILLEVQKVIEYELVVKAMDAVREKVVTGAGDQKMKYPLFQSVALTDLPY